MRTTKDLFNKFIDRLPAGEEFQPRDISLYIDRVTFVTSEHKIPYDSTMTKYIRNRRRDYKDVEVVDKKKSIYRKTK